MLRYYAWAVAEKTLSYTPGGKRLFRTVGEIAQRGSRGAKDNHAGGAGFKLVRKAKETVAPGGTILDVGTGYYHHDAFVLYLAGDWQLELMDIEDRARLPYIRNYLGWLRENLATVCSELDIPRAQATEKLDELLALPSREAIYERCRFRLHVPDDLTRPFLPAGSVDFMLSNCVLVHVRPDILHAELVALQQMLADDGTMYHMLGHDDHWSFHDPKIPQPSFNYLRYSDRIYWLLFDTRLEYHNRIIRPEWVPIFERAGLRVLDYECLRTDASREAVRKLPKLASRYRQRPLDDLAIVYSYFLLGKAGAGERPAAKAQPARNTSIDVPDTDDQHGGI